MHDETTAKVVSSDAPGIPLTLRQKFLAASDYATFVASIVGDAEAGDIDAQYYLYAALTYCGEGFRMSFRRRKGNGWLTLDEALVRAAGKRELSLEVIGAVDRKCRKLMEAGTAGFGDPGKWLQRAADGGQPVALAVIVDSRLTDKLLGKGHTFDAASARDQLIAALKSKEPEVLWRIGGMQELLGENRDDSKKWAWWLAACERGYECGPENPLVEYACRFDQMCQPGENAVDYMKRTLQTDFPAVEALARDINSKIDAEAWPELPIGD